MISGGVNSKGLKLFQELMQLLLLLLHFDCLFNWVFAS